jgi:hypothetical protein
MTASAGQGPIEQQRDRLTLVAKHGVLKHQFASGPDRVHGDGCDLKARRARSGTKVANERRSGRAAQLERGGR